MYALFWVVMLVSGCLLEKIDMRTGSGHDNALGKQVHAALQHISALGAQLVQPRCQPARAETVNVRDSIVAPYAPQALAVRNWGEQLCTAACSATSVTYPFHPADPRRLADCQTANSKRTRNIM